MGRLLLLVLVLFNVLVNVSGCASVASGTEQSVIVQTVCEGVVVTGAACVLKNDKGQWETTSFNPKLIRKSYANLDVSCHLGEATGTNTYESKNTGAVWGNILAGGVIGYAVDANRGAGFDYPDRITIALSPPCPQ